jgi:hypothetical protein
MDMPSIKNGSDGATVSERVAVAVLCPLSVAAIWTLNVPAAFGMPEIAPFVSDRPGGSPATDQL